MPNNAIKSFAIAHSDAAQRCCSAPLIAALASERKNPDMSQAPVILEEYDQSWPTRFEEERNLLMGVAAEWCYGGIEHIGSTAVPGMVAKPVIDIMFGVKSLEESKPAIEVVKENGYEYWPYKAEIMHWFCKPSDAYRTHHLHLIPFKSPLWNEHIRFRDLLRSNKQIAEEYSTLKQELAAAYKEDRETYTENKGPFIQQVLQSNQC